MKYLRLIIAGLALVAANADAQLAWKSDVLEFHPNISDTEVNCEFPFTNVGTKPITITEIKPACGCTTAKIDKNTYAPGEKGVIKAIYAIHGSVGYQEKPIAVATDDNSIKTLVIKAFIPELASIVPRNVSWLLGDSPSPKDVSIKIVYQKPVIVLGIECSTDRVFAKLKTISNNKDYVITITPLDTSAPVVGGVIVKVLLPESAVPRMFFIPFKIDSKPF